MDNDNTKKQMENKFEKDKVVEFDDLISSAGEFGRYQLLLLFSTLPFHAFAVFVYYSQLFMTEVSPNHWCWIPELENLTELQRRDFGIPIDDNARFGYSQCEMYAVNWKEVLETHQKPDPSWPAVPCQHGWEFNKSEIPYPTISSEMGWVCDKNSYQATAQSLFFLGSMVGGIIIGWIADRYGRLPATVASCAVGFIGGFASTFAQSFNQFATARLIMGMSYDNCVTMVYLLVLEYVAPSYRTLMANMSSAIFYSLFVTVIPWIALACGHWKTISLVTSIPLALGLLTPLVLPESPTWLLSRGRVEEAVKKVLVIGRINKREMHPKMIEQFKITAKLKHEDESQSILEIFKRPVVRKMFILICVEFMCCTIIFDALVRSLGQLKFDFFISFSLVSFTECPSIFLVAFIMDMTGRRWLILITMTICSIFCVLTVLASGIYTVIFAVIARFAVNMAYNTCVQWTAEILPTSVRGSGVAVAHICGGIATMLSPYIVYLQVYLPWLPLVTIACIAACGALIPLGLPETARKDMPQTFQEAEELTKNQSLWKIPFMQKEKVKSGHVNSSYETDA